MWDGTFHGKFEDKTYAIARFNEHNEAVKSRVPAERLVVHEVKEGWKPLADMRLACAQANRRKAGAALAA